MLASKEEWKREEDVVARESKVLFRRAVVAG